MVDILDYIQQKKILDDVTFYYHKKLFNLPKTHDVWRYLFSRGLTIEIIQKNLLGYSYGIGLSDYLTRLGYDNEHIKRFVTSKNMDFFSQDRVIIPFIHKSKIKNITSRSIKDARPKYKLLRSLENKKQWKIMYSINVDKNFNDLYVVEGIFDKLILEVYGVNVCCFIGTSGWENEYKEILYDNKVERIFCIPDREDNKKAYNNNIRNYWKIYDSTKIPTYIIELPRINGKKNDPAEYYSYCGNDLLKFWNTMTDLTRNAKHIESIYNKPEPPKLNKSSEKIEKYSILDILESIGYDMNEVKQMGDRAYFRCPNPEHTDYNPSACIYLETNTWYCHACTAGWDAIDLLRYLKGFDFKEALKYVQEVTLNGAK